MSKRLLHIGLIGLLLFLTGPQTAQANKLEGAASPYLLSHKDDAIHWNPWSDAVLQRARDENKPVFLSIGYSACHWCHVMARKTFVDERVIHLLNENFISVLVDQEERPDIAGHFLDIMEVMAGQRGTPANFLLTPDIEPIYAAGYLSPRREFGAPGLIDILQMFVRDWKVSRKEMTANALEFYQEHLRLKSNRFSTATTVTPDPVDKVLAEWERAFDLKYGGFGSQPKFPMVNVLSFLLHEGVARDDKGLLSKIFFTLDAMAAGGIRDQIGGAFHRYAVDRYWQVPHFEIMLHENALLAILYTDAWKATSDPGRKGIYARVVRGILDDLVARFLLPDGAFAASLDSESDGHEGPWYTWLEDEIRALLPDTDEQNFLASFVDSKYGLVNKRSVLRLQKGAEDFVAAHDRHTTSLQILSASRNKRPSPARGEKVLTSWNAMVISAFARAAQTFGVASDHEMARSVLQSLAPDRAMTHSRLGNKVMPKVFLDDYAFLVESYLDLYETDFQIIWLEQARAFADQMVHMFQSAKGQPLQLVPIADEDGLPAQHSLVEVAVPTGNAAAISALFRLALYDPDGGFQQNAMAMARTLQSFLADSGSQATGLLKALRFSPQNSFEIVIVGNIDDPESRAMLSLVRQHLLPGAVIAFVDEIKTGVADYDPHSAATWGLFEPRPKIDGRVTAYLCRQRLCKLPVNTAGAFAAQLDAMFIETSRP
ncbi:MAG: thioredoxin domain-containing protein [Alphaproteobacteria bacterium]|nr:thioredoxin domain-containing protein [Alphaproteobacteria bacterium]MBT4085328.1 thioredoxin domain-containing protein [Alphaproteobacteria bacterium]MBT4544145.1 thioredoxin domain-containing protein [Alphaproteobacteria bacterium]MBT7746996.1 thioredoxin domain-containing protein [Alphaproteobacteria bacterium]